MLVHTDHLTKRYGDMAALSDCSLGIAGGVVFGLLGPNGSGKTTLLRLLLGYLRPTEGRATIGGLDCHRDSVAVHRRLSYLPGEPRLHRRMRGDEALTYFSQLRPDGRLQRSREIADRLNLDLTRQVARISTGMRQMLALCMAMSLDVPLLVLDEPTSSLDPTVRSEVLALVREAQTEGRTVIFSSHVLSEVEEVCDRVAILRRGNLVQEQDLSHLQLQHRIVARLSGPSSPPPDAIRHLVSKLSSENGELRIEAPGELTPLLGWLATLPVSEMRIEPLGLRTVYDQIYREPRDA
ncbi:MAG: ABC transporter ATP-binding protein [Planctomycetia bacterium]|nr:ABC transporter ATP-binding protein [Planctomycetia bacterium]